MATSHAKNHKHPLANFKIASPLALGFTLLLAFSLLVLTSCSPAQSAGQSSNSAQANTSSTSSASSSAQASTSSASSAASNAQTGASGAEATDVPSKTLSAMLDSTLDWICYGYNYNANFSADGVTPQTAIQLAAFAAYTDMRHTDSASSDITITPSMLDEYELNYFGSTFPLSDFTDVAPLTKTDAGITIPMGDWGEESPFFTVVSKEIVDNVCRVTVDYGSTFDSENSSDAALAHAVYDIVPNSQSAFGFVITNMDIQLTDQAPARLRAGRSA